MTDRRVIPDYAERLQEPQDGWRELLRCARLIVGDAPAIVAEALDIATPWFVLIGISGIAFWWAV